MEEGGMEEGGVYGAPGSIGHVIVVPNSQGVALGYG